MSNGWIVDAEILIVDADIELLMLMLNWEKAIQTNSNYPPFGFKTNSDDPPLWTQTNWNNPPLGSKM